MIEYSKENMNKSEELKQLTDLEDIFKLITSEKQLHQNDMNFKQ